MGRVQIPLVQSLTSESYSMSCWLSMNGLAGLIIAGIGWGLGSITHSVLPAWKWIFLVSGRSLLSTLR